MNQRPQERPKIINFLGGNVGVIFSDPGHATT